MAKKVSVFKYKCKDGILTVLDRKDPPNELAVFDSNDYNDDIRQQIFDYGLKQKLVDSASEGTSPKERLDMMEAMHANLLDGEFTREREGGARVVSVEVEAISRIKSCSIPAAQKALAALTDEKREKILKSKAVVEMAATIRKEREAAEEIDLEDIEEEETAE